MARTDNVVIVLLRRPRNAEDLRADPFWEFGSFGRTGCHGKTLLHYVNAPKRLPGSRLAFAQGGRRGWRLVYLTPPVDEVRRVGKRRCLEVLWSVPKERKPSRKAMPFRYDDAPLLIGRAGGSRFKKFAETIAIDGRPTAVSQFASNFRSRVKPLGKREALDIVKVYERERRNASSSMIAKRYEEALPDGGKRQRDDDRRATYDGYLLSRSCRAKKMPRRRRDIC